MKQYQVPQFITVEDKVIGNYLTLKQFAFVGAGALLILGMRAILAPFLFFPLAILIGILAGGLAFFRYNEQPFPTVVKNGIVFFFRPRVYIWKKDSIAVQHNRKKEQDRAPTIPVLKSLPKLSTSRLSDLAWSLDIKQQGDKLIN